MGQLLNIKGEVVHEWTQEEFDTWREENYDEETGLCDGNELRFYDTDWADLSEIQEEMGLDNETMRIWKA